MFRIVKIFSLLLFMCFFSLQDLCFASDDGGDPNGHRKRPRAEASDGGGGSGAAGGVGAAAAPPSPEAAAAAAFLERSGSHHYAIATTDTAFKHMLSISMGSDKAIVISFLNNFVPAFQGDAVEDVEEVPVALPALRRPGEKQTFMDLHVKSSRGVHYIIEMQARRHVMFDERALFYACSTYARQLSESDLSKEDWYIKLQPVIALQILDYDTNRARGLTGDVPDTLVSRVQGHLLPEDSFIKHYVLKDETSGQKIDHLQMVQVELPRAKKTRDLSPASGDLNRFKDFTETEWWLSLLNYANEYTDEIVELLRKEGAMPENIYKALKRLDLTEWNPRQLAEYSEAVTNRSVYATVLAVERSEGKAEGIAEGKAKAGLKMIQSSQLTRGQVIDILELTEAEVTLLDSMLADGSG